MKAKAIIFDKDGTLFPYSIWRNPIINFLDTEMPLTKLDKEKKEECIKEFLKIIGFQEDGSINAKGLFIKKNYFSSFFSLVKVTFNYHLNPIKSAMSFLKIKHRCRYGYKEELEKYDFGPLKRILGYMNENGVSLAVFTNDTKESLDIFLSAFGRQYFSFVVDDSSLHTKPSPKTIKDYSLFSKIQEKDMMLFSDNPKDLKMARKAGVGTIVGIDERGEKKEMKALSDYVFPDIISALSFFIS